MKGGQELTILLIGVCLPIQLMVYNVLLLHQNDVIHGNWLFIVIGERSEPT